MGRLFLNDERQKETPPTSMKWMGLSCLKVTKQLVHKDAARVGLFAAVE